MRNARGPPLFKRFSPTLIAKRNFFSAILLLENYIFFSSSRDNRRWRIRIWQWKIGILDGKQRKEDFLAGRIAKLSDGRFWSEKISGKIFGPLMMNDRSDYSSSSWLVERNLRRRKPDSRKKMTQKTGFWRFVNPSNFESTADPIPFFFKSRIVVRNIDDHQERRQKKLAARQSAILR